MKIFFAWLLITIICLSNSSLAYAESPNKISSSSPFSVQDLSLIRKIGEPINLEELGAESWKNTPENSPSEYELIKLADRLRDVGRYLGTTWPVIVPIPVSEIQNKKASSWRITDFRDTEGEWLSLSSGHALRFVIQELEALKSSSQQPLVDFLVTDEGSKVYRQLLGISLDRYCRELLNLFDFSAKPLNK